MKGLQTRPEFWCSVGFFRITCIQSSGLHAQKWDLVLSGVLLWTLARICKNGKYIQGDFDLIKKGWVTVCPKGNTVFLHLLLLLRSHTLPIDTRFRSTSKHFAHIFVTRKKRVPIFSFRSQKKQRWIISIFFMNKHLNYWYEYKSIIQLFIFYTYNEWFVSSHKRSVYFV